MAACSSVSAARTFGVSGSLYGPLLFVVWLHSYTYLFVLTMGANKVAYQIAYMLSVIPVIYVVLFTSLSELSVSKLSILFPALFVLAATLSNILGSPTEVWLPYQINLIWLFVICVIVSAMPPEKVALAFVLYAKLGVIYLAIMSLLLLFFTESYILELHRNYLAMNCIPICVCAASLKSVRFKILIYSVSILVCLLLVSRASLLCVSLVISLDYILFRGENKNGNVPLFDLRKVAVFVVVIFSVVLIVSKKYSNEVDALLLITNEYRGIDTGLSGRTDKWRAALMEVESRPYFGHGYGQSDAITSFSIDSAYITVAFELGILGLGIYLGAVIFSVINGVRLFRCDPKMNRSVLIMIGVYLVYGIFERRHINVGNAFSILFCISLFCCLKFHRKKYDF